MNANLSYSLESKDFYEFFCLESVLDIKYSTLMFKSTLFHYKLPIVEDYRHQILILAVKDLIDEIRTHCVLNTITVLCFSPNTKKKNGTNFIPLFLYLLSYSLC